VCQPVSVGPKRTKYGLLRKKRVPVKASNEEPTQKLSRVYNREEFLKKVVNRVLDAFDETNENYGQLSCAGLYRRLEKQGDNGAPPSQSSVILDGDLLADISLAYDSALPHRKIVDHGREALTLAEIKKLGCIFLKRKLYPLQRYYGICRNRPVDDTTPRENTELLDENQHGDYSETDGFDVEVIHPALPAWAAEDSGLGLD
jgi:hypothetical protein